MKNHLNFECLNVTCVEGCNRPLICESFAGLRPEDSSRLLLAECERGLEENWTRVIGLEAGHEEAGLKCDN